MSYPTSDVLQSRKINVNRLKFVFVVYAPTAEGLCVYVLP